VRSPTDHSKRILGEACPNHAYPIKYKLRDNGLMKSFMTSGSLSQGMEVNEVPDEEDVMPFLEQDAIVTIYNRRPSSKSHHVPDPSLGTPARSGQGCRNLEMEGHEFSCTLPYVNIYICMYITYTPKAKKERGREKQQAGYPGAVVTSDKLSFRLGNWH
jgi:hypothetical protein